MRTSHWQKWLEQATQVERPSPNKDGFAAGRPAAVLIAVAEVPEPVVYFTQRSQALRHHPGQVSFPGGRWEAGDAGLADTALREAREEIGLDGRHVRILGALPNYHTGTGFTISPFVGWIGEVQPLSPDQREVDRIFGVPLSYAAEPSHYRTKVLCRQGRRHSFYALDYEDNHIWGATAGILIDLAARLAEVRGLAFSMPRRL